VFIRKAYEILRNHDDLHQSEILSTQLVISTHSSHIAHECDFSSLRYFRRRPALAVGSVPTSTVVNLTEVFGKEDETNRFVTRYIKSTHCDLFFADAAIMVEGAAERILIPHFIRENCKELRECYITILEIGGSHAHQLKALIEHLGLITLIITDIDSADPSGHHPSRQPLRSKNLITGNDTLEKWIPKKSLLDELLNIDGKEKVKEDDTFTGVRVAYQTPVILKLDNVTETEFLPNTFEDSFVL